MVENLSSCCFIPYFPLKASTLRTGGGGVILQNIYLFTGFYFRTRNLKHLKMWVCGPRRPGHCRQGARISSPCAHTTTAIYLLGVVAHNPGVYQSGYREINYLDPGTTFPHQYSSDLFANVFA